MNYYVIKNVSDVTQAQLNAANARKAENVRKSKNGSKCILKFDDSKQEYFINESWFTLEEIQFETEKAEWNMDIEELSFMGKTLSFLGLK